MKRIALFDAPWYMHRAFHVFAMPAIKHALRTNTAPDWHGLLVHNVIGWICKDALRLQAKHLCAFVDGGESFRYEIYPEYKEGRGFQELPDEADPADSPSPYDALPVFFKAMKNYGLPYCQLDRYESDDLFASFIKHYPLEEKDRVYVVTQDKDMYQLISDQVCVYTPGTKKRQELMVTPKNIGKYRHGLTPSKFLDLQTLMGDAVDKIPGVLTKSKALAIVCDPSYTNMKTWFQTPEGRKLLAAKPHELVRNRLLVKLNRRAFKEFLPDIVPTFPKNAASLPAPTAYKNFVSFASSKTRSLF